jgi:hypothetical protein
MMALRMSVRAPGGQPRDGRLHLRGAALCGAAQPPLFATATLAGSAAVDRAGDGTGGGVAVLARVPPESAGQRLCLVRPRVRQPLASPVRGVGLWAYPCSSIPTACCRSISRSIGSDSVCGVDQVDLRSVADRVARVPCLHLGGGVRGAPAGLPAAVGGVAEPGGVLRKLPPSFGGDGSSGPQSIATSTPTPVHSCAFAGPLRKAGATVRPLSRRWDGMPTARAEGGPVDRE